MIKIIVTFILFVVSTSFSQSGIGFEFDFAQFAYDSSSNYLECYYAYSQNSMTIERTDTLNSVKGILHITLQDTSSGQIILDKDWRISHNVSDDTLQNKQSLIGVLGFVLKGGVYKCEVSGIDALSQESKRTITEYIHVNPFMPLPMAMSDIQLASNIIQGSQKTESVFYKNTYEIIPIPTVTFGENQPVLFYYLELYNVKKEDTNFYLFQNVVNSRGQVVNQKYKFIRSKVNSRVEVGSIMTYKLPTDAYSLFISLVDSSDNIGITSSKKFFVYNPSVEYVDTFKTGNKNVVSGMFGSMSDEELEDFYDKSKYIATNLEKDKFESLTEIGAKREFLTQFWNDRSDNNYDARNQALNLYMKRIEEANTKFGSFSKKGWKTDRGRIFIIYGEPSEINRYPNQIETKPYEIWRYDNIEGGVEFVFADITGFSEYILVHSTKRGELRDDNWQNRIAVH